MATFEEFLNERNITLKRRYTENHPAQTVGNSAKVRNAIIEALKDGKITVDEFNEIVGQHSSAPSKWTRGNKRFFKIRGNYKKAPFCYFMFNFFCIVDSVTYFFYSNCMK